MAMLGVSVKMDEMMQVVTRSRWMPFAEDPFDYHKRGVPHVVQPPLIDATSIRQHHHPNGSNVQHHGIK